MFVRKYRWRGAGAGDEMARLKLRLVFEDGSLIGPGRADLLEGIAETGSIAAAGRRMGMSYKRAWSLVTALNGMFEVPLVVSSRGGAKGGSAHLSSTGRAALDAFRTIEEEARRATAGHIAELSLLRRGKGVA